MKKVLSLILIFIGILSITSCKKNENTVDGPKEDPIVYAQVKGSVVYYFNKYKGNVPDNGSKVVLLKVVDTDVSDEIAEKIHKAIKNPSIYYEGSETEYAEYGLYMAKVDSTGKYELNNVPNGKYTLYIHSNHVDTATSIPNTYKVGYMQIPFTEDQVYHYSFDEIIESRWVGLFKYTTKQITINGTSYNCGETDFGMCWSGDYGTCNPWK